MLAHDFQLFHNPVGGMDNVSGDGGAMAKLHELCKKTVDETEGAIACGVVDLKTARVGMHHTLPALSKEELNRVGAAVVEMFHDNPLLLLEGQSNQPQRAREIFVASSTAFYFMKSVPEKNMVFVLLTRIQANQGMGWVQLRKAVADFKRSEGLSPSQALRSLGGRPIVTREATQRIRVPRSGMLKSSKPLPRRPAHLTPIPKMEGHGAGTTLNLDHPAIRRAFPSIGGNKTPDRET